jgi:hypothetical protein
MYKWEDTWWFSFVVVVLGCNNIERLEDASRPALRNVFVVVIFCSIASASSAWVAVGMLPRSPLLASFFLNQFEGSGGSDLVW